MAESWLNAGLLFIEVQLFLSAFQISVYGVKSIQQELQIFSSKLNKFGYFYPPKVVGVGWVTQFKVGKHELCRSAFVKST